MSQLDTKTRILDAAEQLFAQEGFHNTSMRAITGAAEVNLAAVNYHFGSKEALLQEVFERRLLPLNQIRTDRLQQVLEDADQSGTPPAVVNLMRAFIEPTLEFRKKAPGNRAFIALIGRSMSEMDSTVRDCFIHLVEPMFKLLFSSLTRALPNLLPDTLYRRLQFSLGSMAHTMCFLDQAQIPVDLTVPPSAGDDLTESLIGFVCAGLEAPC